MNTEAKDLPKSFVDIEPLRKDFFPKQAISLGELALKNEAEPLIIPALGLIIPNQNNPKKILYAQRDPQTNKEFPGAWGLPSVSMTIEELLALEDGAGQMLMNKSASIVEKVSNKKLGGMALEPDRFQAWTGRYRTKNDPRFDKTYYLIMVDISTKPVDPTTAPLRTDFYSDFAWLTPQEHQALVAQADVQACGACSQITHLLAESGDL